MSNPENTQEEQNTEDIAQNTEAIAENTAAISQNLATLNAGGEERWKSIHANERKIQANTDDINVLNLVKLRSVQFKVNVVAAFVLIMLMIFAILLQVQASHMQDQLDQVCRDSQTRTQTLNEQLALDTQIPIPSCE